jgi:hypothetical protein
MVPRFQAHFLSPERNSRKQTRFTEGRQCQGRPDRAELRVRAPQTRGSPPMRRGKADGGGRDARPPSAQKIAQLVPSDLVVSRRVESQVSTFYTSIKNASGTGFV